MLKIGPIILIFATFCCLSRPQESGAQEANIYSMMSPKLRQLVASHPDLSQAFSNVLSEASSNRTVQLYYFYSDSESVPRAAHYYMGKSSVVIGVRENQEPSDQCICLIFEMLNSEGEERFLQLNDEALAGKISKADFVKECMHQEFQAVKKLQKLLKSLKDGGKDFLKSGYYEGFIECPDTFEAYFKYVTSAAAERNEMQEFGQMYDQIQAGRQRSNAALAPTR